MVSLVDMTQVKKKKKLLSIPSPFPFVSFLLDSLFFMILFHYVYSSS